MFASGMFSLTAKRKHLVNADISAALCFFNNGGLTRGFCAVFFYGADGSTNNDPKSQHGACVSRVGFATGKAGTGQLRHSVGEMPRGKPCLGYKPVGQFFEDALCSKHQPLTRQIGPRADELVRSTRILVVIFLLHAHSRMEVIVHTSIAFRAQREMTISTNVAPV